MALIDLNALYGIGDTEFSDVFQTEAGTTIGYVRKTVKVTGTAGVKLKIGHVLQDNGDGTATIPATTASITNPVVYCGDDPVLAQTRGIRDFNANNTVFTADDLTKDVVVVYRGRVGVGRSFLVFPSDATATTKETVFEALNEKGIQPIRQIAAYA